MRKNLNMRRYQRGISAVIVLVVLVFLILVAAAGSYYILKNAGYIPANYNLPFLSQSTPSPAPSEVSDSTEVNDLEKEIEGTVVDSEESEIKQLESEASSL